MDDKYAYAKYDNFDELSYTCIKYLMDNNEIIWPLLKYPTPDAWEKPYLSQQEKADLIYKGEGNIFDYHVFMDTGQDDVILEQSCVIRISPYSVYSEGRTTGTIYINFEVYCNYKINHLTNYKTRVDMVMKQFIQTFNGANVGGIGLLNMDKGANQNARMEIGGQIPAKGKWLLMAVKSG
jgi:hypothetical protein